MKKITMAILVTLMGCMIGVAGCEKKGQEPGLPTAQRTPYKDADNGNTINPKIPAPTDKLLLNIKERAERAARKADQTEEEYARAKNIAEHLMVYKYSASAPRRTGNSLVESKMNLPTGHWAARSLTRDKAEELTEELAALGNYGLAVIANSLQFKLKPAPEAQVFRALGKSNADPALIDALLLWGMNSKNYKVRNWACIFIRNAEDHSAILPGLVDLAAAASNARFTINYCLMMIYEFQHKNGLEPMLTQEQLAALRAQYNRYKILLRASRNEKEINKNEFTAVLLARVLAERHYKDIEADLCVILWEKFTHPKINTEADKYLTTMIMRFFGNKKTSTGSVETLVRIVTAQTSDGQQAHYYCDVREAFCALGEIAADEKGIKFRNAIKRALSQVLQQRVNPDIAMEIIDALVNIGDADTTKTLLEICRTHKDPLIQLYSVRGLGQILRKNKADAESRHDIVKEAFARWRKEKDESLMAAWIRILGAAHNGVTSDEETADAIADLKMILQETERSVWIRSIAAEEMSNYNLKEVRRALAIEYDRTDNADIHYFIIKALGEVGDNESAKKIIKIARDADSTILEACSRSLAVLLRKDKFKLEELMLRYAEPEIGHGEKRNLLECLARIRGTDNPKKIDPVDKVLVTLFKAEQDEDLKSQVLYYINQRFRPGIMPADLEEALAAALRSRRQETYFYAVIILTKLNSKKSLPLISELLDEKNMELPVLRAIYQAMYTMGGSDEIPLILSDIKDYGVLKSLSNKRIMAHVMAAKESVARFDTDMRRKKITEIIDNTTDENLRFAAILATTDFASGEFVEKLTAILKNKKSSARAISAAMIAMSIKGRSEILPEVIEMAKCDDPELVAAAASALGTLKSFDGAEALVMILEKENDLPEYRRNQNLIDVVVQALSNIAIKEMTQMGATEEHRNARIQAFGGDATEWRKWLGEHK